MRIGIVGLGLIGGSLGGALGLVGHEISGYDIAPGRQSRALQLGWIESASPLRELAATSEVVILAAPVLRIAGLLPAVDAAAPADTIIIDTGSAKGAVVEAMSICPGAHRMVGGHPLAGSEQSGPEAADPALFRDRPFVLTPGPATDPAFLAAASALVSEAGARPVVMDAREHDRIVAGTSHLPQILSSLLRVCVPPDSPLIGPGYLDMTRLADSDVTLWRDVLLANAAEISGVTRRYRDRLDELLAALEREDAASIERLLGLNAAEVAP
ncbi:MAG TPA: prephenate dehydrogenase/arogenate dehydrogenase family protein [Chloroflexota bacterium]|nr:prephenate dehydrogenase/arogenate dehydrogenase family protein [Chloroflexota bacterium]